MTVNHDVAGSSPAAGVIRHHPKFFLGFFNTQKAPVSKEMGADPIYIIF